VTETPIGHVEDITGKERILPQLLVFFFALVVMILILLPSSTSKAPAGTEAESTVHVFFIEPVDNAVVPSTFTVRMGAEGVTVEPAGEVHPNAGHFHLIVDGDFAAPGEAVPADETHLHFGQGQTETQLTLTPGVHVLRLQLADGQHRGLEGDQYRAEITITVSGG